MILVVRTRADILFVVTMNDTKALGELVLDRLFSCQVDLVVCNNTKNVAFNVMLVVLWTMYSVLAGACLERYCIAPTCGRRREVVSGASI